MDKLLNINQLADILGVEVSTIYSWTHGKKIPYVKLGKLIRFKESEVTAWLQIKTIAPTEKGPKLTKTPASRKFRRSRATNSYIDALVERTKNEILH